MIIKIYGVDGSLPSIYQPAYYLPTIYVTSLYNRPKRYRSLGFPPALSSQRQQLTVARVLHVLIMQVVVRAANDTSRLRSRQHLLTPLL